MFGIQFFDGRFYVDLLFSCVHAMNNFHLLDPKQYLVFSWPFETVWPFNCGPAVTLHPSGPSTVDPVISPCSDRYRYAGWHFSFLSFQLFARCLMQPRAIESLHKARSSHNETRKHDKRTHLHGASAMPREKEHMRTASVRNEIALSCDKKTANSTAYGVA